MDNDKKGWVISGENYETLKTDDSNSKLHYCVRLFWVLAIYNVVVNGYKYFNEYINNVF